MDQYISPGMGWAHFDQIDLLVPNFDVETLFERLGWWCQGNVIKIELSKSLDEVFPNLTHFWSGF